MEVITNNHERSILSWHDLAKEEQSEFDYMDDDCKECASFFRYMGNVYDLGEAIRVPEKGELEKLGWQGMYSESAFCGVVVRYTQDLECIVVGMVFS